MAGNIRGDNSGNILVEFDYNNIIVVDPNKTIDEFGKINERIVDHENLVMYANLEAEILPRTKLAVGGSPNDRVRISVAKINFLKPTKNNYLGSEYYDELTGNDTTKFKGKNQMLSQVSIPQNGDKPYVITEPANLKNVEDNGLLGITQISVTTNSSFVPSVKIELEDVQGKALFQLGDNSPYAAFFNLPYPQFYLTLKGYYGQAIRYQLNLEKFNARFNTFSGNYQVSLEFRGYKFNILNEISMGHLLAVPHMYSTRFDVKTNPVQSQQSQNSALSSGNNNIIQNQGLATSNSEGVIQVISKKGYQKIVEVYSEYKSKGLIPPDFPELTLAQLMNKLETFEKLITQSYPKVEVEPLTNIRTYKQFLRAYFDDVRGGNNSWFAKYINPKPLVLTGGKVKLYALKSELDLRDTNTAISELRKIIADYNKKLSENPTLGNKGQSKIVNPIKYDMIAVSVPNQNSIDWIKTTSEQLGVITPTNAQIENIKSQYKNVFTPRITQTPENQKEILPIVLFTFEGEGRFDNSISTIEAEANKKLSEFEASISAKLLAKISDKAVGIGFKPTVRNIIAVIMASTEAFIRLMDEVHTNAWNVRYDSVRKNAILNNVASAPNSDSQDFLPISEQAYNQNSNLKFSEIPVYPWPQFFVESSNDKNRFQIKYIADPTVVDITKGYLYEKWPEVEFVEEYLKGLTEKFDSPAAPPPLDNERYTNKNNINAIEFPNFGLAYTNKEEVKFFYEIWERQFVTARYSNLLRANRNKINDIMKLNIEIETTNIVDSLGLSSPFLTWKLKNYDLNSSNYVETLKNISNAGTGRAYQEFIRDLFVTPYLKNLTENSFGILNALELGKIPQVNTTSQALNDLIATSSNDPLIIDTLPFTDYSWTQNNLADGKNTTGSAVFNTNKTLKVFEPRKVIANFTDTFNFTENRPVTSFSYLSSPNPNTTAIELTSKQVGLNAFYIPRLETPEKFIPTEGTISYLRPTTSNIVQTTTSMLNSPYFVNSILNGVYNNRRNDPYPYVQAAYLFLNSLPLATLKEKYKKLNGSNLEDLDYIASVFKKFGAIHKLPYAWILKLGANWHRYKKFKQTGVDILSGAWKNFDYLANYSPILSSETQTYTFKYPKSNVTQSIVMQEEKSNTINMNVGFYPKVITDFTYFYTGFDLYENYTNEEIQNSINLGMKVHNFQTSNLSVNQSGKSLNLNTWSVLLPELESTNGGLCAVKNNTTTLNYFIIPSFGSQTNQVNDECISAGTSSKVAVVSLTSNPNVYNGSVRTLWSSPNYGYFSANEIAYPQVDSYLTKINPNRPSQTPLSFLNKDEYSKIEEIFSVFEKRILDTFEEQFLNFSKPKTNADIIEEPTEFLQSNVQLNANFRNFQSFMGSLMSVSLNPNITTDNDVFNNTISEQYLVFMNGIKSFMEYDVIFKYGNPSNYKRRIWDSYLSHNNTETVVDPIKFQPYIQNSLPSSGGTVTLEQSKNNNRRAWTALETEVGFSTIPNVQYSSNGSYITDFFIQNNIQFTVENVTILAPIIKIWTAQKVKTPTLTAQQFRTNLQQYLNNSTNLQNDFLNQVLSSIRAKLPNQQELPERVIKSVAQGEQGKVELYETFKALNDKWIAGSDFTNRTIFEDMLFLDRASRNIGDTIVLDIFDLKNMLSKNSLNNAMSVFVFISGILIKNNFTVMNLPAYVNFYNVQELDGTTIPQAEGSLESANSLWGTFLDVDYRKTGPKMVCFFVGKPSEYLELPSGNFRFRNDGFDMSRASDNPLIENQKGKQDWGVSNKCVGFNVDIGTRNQNIFYSFSVGQDSGVATSESINTYLNMVNQANGRNTATQNVSLFNYYKSRSYTCEVISLGNALIQPTMYFNLRHVPMFYGPYMITQVEHSIQPGNFQTKFTGIRQGRFSLETIDNFIQSINQNLLTKLEELVKIEKDKPIVPPTTDNNKSSQLNQKNESKVDTPNSCVNNVDTNAYPDYVITTANKTTLTPKEFANKVKEVIKDDARLQSYVFIISYINSFVENDNKGSGNFVGYNNNFGTISLYDNYKPTSDQYFNKSYCCVSVKGTSSVTRSEPVVSFKSVEGYIQFMKDRLSSNVDRIDRLGIDKYYACYWPKTNISETYFESNAKEFETLFKTVQRAELLAKNTDIITQQEYNKIMEARGIKIPQSNSNPSVTPTPTPTPIPPLPGQTCPPPYLETISPKIGNTGTIIQLTGKNFDIVNGITINGVEVDMKTVNIYNTTTMRVSVPKINTSQPVKGSIILRSQFGNSQSNTPNLQFTYDPTINPSAPSSAGGYQNNSGT